MYNRVNVAIFYSAFVLLSNSSGAFDSLVAD